MSVKISSFSVASTGNASISGLTFLPEEIEIWVKGNSAGTINTAYTATSRGWATVSNSSFDSEFRDATGPEETDGINQIIGLRYRNAGVMADRVKATFVSFDTITPGSNYGFTLNFTAVDASRRLRYRVRG